MADIDEENGLKTVNSISEQGGQAVFAKGDVTSSADAERLVATAVERFGRLDILANVVGGSRPGQTAVDLPEAEWDRLIKFNLYGTFLMCKYAIPRLIEAGGGAIVNVASGAGINGMPKNPAYCAAKGGVISLTKALAIDHGRDKIRVNCVSPGAVLTELMIRNRTPEEIEQLGRMNPLGRLGDPRDLADTILYLASEEASFITGQTISASG